MAIDTKYGKLDIAGVGEDEPVFVLRARDVTSVGLIEEYRARCIEAGSPAQHMEGIERCLARFNAWRAVNADQIRVPSSGAKP